jgi:hypothetical protein
MAFKQAILEKTPSVFVQLKGMCSAVQCSAVQYITRLPSAVVRYGITN